MQLSYSLGSYKVSNHVQVSSSIIGRGCRVGKCAHIVDSYLFDNVTVWEGARIENSILCEGVTVMPNASVREGTVVSFKVVYKDTQAIVDLQNAWKILPSYTLIYYLSSTAYFCAGCHRERSGRRRQ